MKIETAISSFLLLLLFHSGPSLAFPTDPRPAFDIHGQPLLTGTKYYIVPTIRGAGSGGLTMVPPLHGTCPFDVAQDHPLLDGLPVTLTPGGASDQNGVAVHTFSNYNIKFARSSPDHNNTCGAHFTTVWKVGTHLRPGTLVTTGGAETNDFRAVFQLVELDVRAFYSFRSCGPSVCYGSVCTRDAVRCVPVGINDDDGSHTRRLAISDVAFRFNFVKA